VIYSAMHWLLVVCVYLLVLQSFGGKLAALKFSDAVLLMVFSLVGSAVQLPGVGGGAQALSIVAFTKLYGVEQDAAVAAAMILWLVTFASCSFAGVPFLIREGWSLGELKRMRQQENAEIDAEIITHPAQTPTSAVASTTASLVIYIGVPVCLALIGIFLLVRYVKWAWHF